MTEEPKEISIIMRNLRLIKRMILGKKNPSLFLRIICIASFIWSLIVILALLGVLFLIYVSPEAPVLEDLNGLSNRFYISYAGLHGLAILGTILIWRKKLMGFYLFSIVSLLMPFWISFFLPVFSFNFYWLVPSVTFIALFGLNWLAFKKQEEEE